MTAWLIERADITGAPEWFGARELGDGKYAFGWYADSLKASRFETKDEAEAWRLHLARIVPGLVGKDTFVTEHEWVSRAEGGGR